MNRELDVKIAKAKGLDVVGEALCVIDGNFMRVDHLDPDSELHLVYLEHIDNPRWYGEKQLGYYEECLKIVPFWSSDMNLCVALANEMIRDGWYFELSCDNGSWCAEIDDMVKTIDASGNTPQEAICRLYLKWSDLTKNQI